MRPKGTILLRIPEKELRSHQRNSGTFDKDSGKRWPLQWRYKAERYRLRRFFINVTHQEGSMHLGVYRVYEGGLEKCVYDTPRGPFQPHHHTLLKAFLCVTAIIQHPPD